MKQIYLDKKKPISSHFLALNIITFHQALNYVHRLPYRRNRDRVDYLSIFNEKRGTCSTKHALIYKLSSEYGIGMTLQMAVFMMNKVNTPKISAILNEYNLSQIPEMHCYLRYKNKVIDITFPDYSPPLELIDEERIGPEHLGDYKVIKHKQFIDNWLIKNPYISYDSEQIFKIRELCIKQLGKL
ncbi:hypothetical protein [Wolbachia endosymbiont (group A) of Therophilus tumidulus]|uniref:hypothetical protein n=1 Tax=Wolbachia endosymbiont (group A) of Therophilus tumidulus TaxID=3066214 RepID=UPI00376EF7BA